MITDVTAAMLDEIVRADGEVVRFEREVEKARENERECHRCGCYSEEDRRGSRHALAQVLSQLAEARALRSAAVGVYDEARRRKEPGDG